jgi:hypothetical protein
MFTGVVYYWGRPWGYGYAPTKTAARLLAAQEAAVNMYVSGIYFERLPRYMGMRPAQAPFGDSGAAAAAAAAAGDAADDKVPVHNAAAAAAAAPRHLGGFLLPSVPQQQQQQKGPQSSEQQ